jgi:hypothetical protein
VVVQLLVGIFVTLFSAYSLRIWIPIFQLSYTFIICNVNESSSLCFVERGFDVKQCFVY